MFWFLHAFIRNRRPLCLFLVAANFVVVLFSNSRAAVLALFFDVAVLLLIWLIFRSGRMLRWLAVLSAIGIVALVADALIPRNLGKTSQLYRLYENARTVTDITGTYVPQTANLSDKPDNNSFRMIRRKAVIDETRDNNPWFGLGFGHDLAERFAMIYYPDETEDFSVRSPHSIVVSIFARMGVVGLV